MEVIINHIKLNMVIDTGANGFQGVMGLDTGATKTFFGKCVKDRFQNTREKKIKVGSAAGIREIIISEIENINLEVDGYEVNLKNSVLFNDNEYSTAHFFLNPGTLGSDLGYEKTMIHRMTCNDCVYRITIPCLNS